MLKFPVDYSETGIVLKGHISKSALGVEISTLSNGIMIVSERVPSVKSIHLGFWIDVGSRDEPRELEGCSHLLEHMLFQGTKNRTASEIDTSIESRGGALNAFTDRDLTCFTAHVLKEDMLLAVEVLSDVLQNPLLESDSIDREKEVVLEEIGGNEDDPRELIDDLSIETFWKGNPAAHSILGCRDTINGMSKDQIQQYFRDHYVPSGIIVTAAGAVEQDRLAEELESRFEKRPMSRAEERNPPEFMRELLFVERNINQVQLCISTEGVPYGHQDRVALDLIAAYLGIGASSKLYQELRVRRGLVYDVEAQNYFMKDAGISSVFASTREQNLEQVLRCILDELGEMRSGIEPARLLETKRKLIGFLSLGSEGTEEKGHLLGIYTMRQGKPKTVQEEIEELQSVTPEQTSRLADHLFDKNKLSIALLGVSPKKGQNLASKLL
jgi:predicted Zn-dependent peptidase